MAANDYGGYTDGVPRGGARVGYNARGQRGGATMWHRDAMAPPQAEMSWYRGAVPTPPGSRLPYDAEPADRRAPSAQLYPGRWGSK